MANIRIGALLLNDNANRKVWKVPFCAAGGCAGYSYGSIWNTARVLRTKAHWVRKTEVSLHCLTEFRSNRWMRGQASVTKPQRGFIKRKTRAFGPGRVIPNRSRKGG